MDDVPGHKGAFQKLLGTGWNGFAAMTCTVIRPQPYNGAVGRRRNRVTSGLGKVSDLEALEAAAIARRRDGSMLQAVIDDGCPTPEVAVAAAVRKIELNKSVDWSLYSY